MGSSVVNALSSWLEVEITRDGAVYKQRFEDGENQLRPLKDWLCSPSLRQGPRSPSCQIQPSFSTTDFKFNTIAERIKESAFLLKDVTLTLTDLP